MARILTVTRTGSGTTSWTVDQDCDVVGIHGSGSWKVSHDPADSATFTSPARVSFAEVGINSSTPIVISKWRLYAGETIYVSTGAANSVWIQLEDVPSSAEIG